MTTQLSPFRRLSILAVGLALLLSMLAAVLPQPAEAAVVCASYYTVRSGDTTVSIAQHFGMKWRKIAEANKLTYPYNLKVGQKLCIPDVNASTSESGKVSVVVRGMNVTVTASKFSARSAFNVKVRAGTAAVGGWYKLGVIKVNKNDTRTMVFTLPSALKTTSPLTVCLKESTTDELICRTVVHQ